MPKTIRYSLGEKISLLFIEFIEYLILASYSGKEQKTALLQKASIKLDLLKNFFQIAFELNAIKAKDLADLSNNLSEVGRQLGGWHKHSQK